MPKVNGYPHGRTCECDQCKHIVAGNFKSEYAEFILISVEKLSTGWWVKFKHIDILTGVSHHNWPLDFWNKEAEKHVKKV